MTDQERIEKFHTLYTAINAEGEPDRLEIAPIASLRLLLVDAFGEQRQADLIAQWNEEPAQGRPGAPSENRAHERRGYVLWQWLNAGLPMDMQNALSHTFVSPLAAFAQVITTARLPRLRRPSRCRCSQIGLFSEVCGRIDGGAGRASRGCTREPRPGAAPGAYTPGSGVPPLRG